jgi:hypothetical protein
MSFNGYLNTLDEDMISNERQEVLDDVKNNGLLLELMNGKFTEKDYRSDIEIVLEAIKQNKKAILCANENVKNNEEVKNIMLQEFTYLKRNCCFCNEDVTIFFNKMNCLGFLLDNNLYKKNYYASPSKINNITIVTYYENEEIKWSCKNCFHKNRNNILLCCDNGVRQLCLDGFCKSYTWNCIICKTEWIDEYCVECK